MGIKEFGILLIFTLFTISIYMGCSSKEEKKSISRGKNIHELYEKVAREREKTLKASHNRAVNESERKRQMAIADSCLKRYNFC